MLLFFSIILLILSGILIFMFSEVRLVIENFELSNLDKKNVREYKVKVGLYLPGKIRLLSIEINNNKISKLSKNNYIKNRIEDIKRKDNYVEEIKRRIGWESIKDLIQKIQINKFKMKMFIDTENVILTSYIVAIVSILVPNLIRDNIGKFYRKKYEFEVSPLYQNQNYIYLKLSSIISIKVVHIINMFRVIGGIKNERASNRRFNVDCYGKY